ncbi:MAG: DUF1559 domain-containing protein [Thermoguttaceae bacterium]|nr:DUF1559 domain-containing protein [Thermoguttaceae bacterium]
MKRIRSIVVCSLAFLFAMTFAFVALAEDKSASDIVKRWMPERPMSVAVVDLQALKIKAGWLETKDYLKKFYPRTLTEPNELTAIIEQFESGLDIFESQIDKFGSVGGNKAYIFVDTFNNSFGSKTPFIVVIPTDAAKAKEAKKIAAQFVQGDFIPEEQREDWQKSFFVKAYKDCIVLAPAENVSGNKDEFFEQLNVYTAHASASDDQKAHVKLFNRMSEGKTAAVQVYLFPNGAFADALENADREAARAGLVPNTFHNGIQSVAIELNLSKEDLDLRLQVFSKDARSAKILYKTLPTLKNLALKNSVNSIESLELRLFITDLVNQGFNLLTPELKDNTLNWSAKNVIKRFEELLPKFDIDKTAGLYAPVTDDVKEEADRIYSLAAPFINKQTIAVVHFDTVGLDGSFEKAGQRVFKELQRLLPETFSGKSSDITQSVNYVQMILKDIDGLLSQIHAVGGRDVYLIVCNDQVAPVKVIVPFDKEKKTEAKKLFYFLRQMRFLSPEDVSSLEDAYFRVIYKNCLIFGIKNDPDVSRDVFNQNLKAFEAEDVPEIRQAFEVSWKYQRKDNSTALSRIQAVINAQCFGDSPIIPLEPLRERLEEKDPELAKLLPEFTDEQFANGAKAIALEIHPDKLFANLHVISKDEQSAREFAEFVKNLKPYFVQLYLRYASENSTQNSPLSPALMKAYYQDYFDSIFNARELEIQGNVLSIRSNNIPEKYKEINSWFTEHGSVVTVGAAVSGVAVALLLPAVASAREAGRNLTNANNLKQMALGMLVHEQIFKRLPDPYTVNEDGKRLHSWRVALLPYLDEKELYDQIRLDEPWDSEWNKQFHDKCPKVYKNPNANLAPDETTYAVVVGENTAFPGAKRINMAIITDGCSNTAMIVERSPVCWMDPNSDIPFEEAIKGVNVSPNGIRSYFRGVFSAVMCDGCVGNFTEDVSTDFLRKLFEINDGKSIDFENQE